MAERFASDLTFILIALIVAAILGFIIGWILRGSKIAALQAKIDDLQRRLKKCQDTKVATPAPKPTPTKVASITPSAPKTNFDAAAAKLALGKAVKLDDLKVVEGIGPKIESILNNAGIKTWAELSKTQASKIKSLLEAQGERFRIHDPKTWPRQAELAFEGKWKDLHEYQEYLDGGKEPS